jgi:hypothetical protein
MNIIKLLIVLLSTSIVQLEASDTVVHGDALKGELWLTSTDELNAIVRKDKIGQVHDFYEVVASKVVSAVGTFLEKASIVEISEVQAKRLVGLNYVCPPGKKSYLVRAVYGSGATGRFHVERLGDSSILVRHSSLGDDFVVFKSALVVHLDFEPIYVYCDVSIVR